VLCETIKRTAFKITRVGQLVAQEASQVGWVCPSASSTCRWRRPRQWGIRWAKCSREMGLDAGRWARHDRGAGPAQRSGQEGRHHGIQSYVGGLSGAFIPVSEDKNMIDAAAAGCLTMEKLEAMTCVCSGRSRHDRDSR
jgi:hypothetical protein